MNNDTKEAINKIHNYALEEIMGERFGRYSKYIIQDRAIPDVRDGLKPVQRRIIFAMYRDRNTYDKAFKKCANAVGNVMGKFHPHGDSSIYEALIRMSQDWKQNHILVEVDGNNGSIDGDSAAAMRYTECRLAKISEELLRDIDKETVMMAPNYSDTIMEPTVLPAKFPNLLVSGSNGISAGYATNIPPHNLGEVIDATIKRIDSPNSKLDTILSIIKGPDFPTGGIVEGMDGLRQAYETGRGKIMINSRYEFVKNKNKEQIVISEIPFEVNKQELVKKIDDIRLDKKVDGMAEVRDESDKDADVRIVIDLKAGADKQLIMNYLFKNTNLQCSYNYNVVAIVNRRPKTLGIIPILDAYIEHLKDVITKRCQFELRVAEKEVHSTEGLVKAISILDEVIRVIRSSKNKADAKLNLIKEFDFSEVQAEVILKLQLYKLTNTDILELEEQLAKLRQLIDLLKGILGSEEKLLARCKEELKAIKKEYAKPRKTEISETVTEINISAEDLIVKERVIVVITKQGYVKKVPLKSYQAVGSDETLLKPGDYVIDSYEVSTTDKIAILTKLGNYIFVPINDLPWCKWKELGKHISNVVTINPDDEIIKSFIINDNTLSDNIVLFTKQGMVKRVKLESFVVSRYNKLYTSMKLKDDDIVVSVVKENENTIIVTESGYYISYKTNEIPLVSEKASGVKGINLKDDNVVSGLTYNETDEFLNIFTNKMTAKRIKLAELSLLSRAKRGSMLMKKVKTNPYLINGALITKQKDMIGLRYLEDVDIIKNTDISIMNIDSTGSSIAKKKYEGVFILNVMDIVPEVVDSKKTKKLTKEEEKQEELNFIEEFKI